MEQRKSKLSIRSRVVRNNSSLIGNSDVKVRDNNLKEEVGIKAVEIPFKAGGKVNRGSDEMNFIDSFVNKSVDKGNRNLHVQTGNVN